MARPLLIGGLALFAACGDGGSSGSGGRGSGTAGGDEPATSTSVVARTAEELMAELGTARVGCVRCHTDTSETAARVAPVRGPALTEAAGWHARDGGESFLRRHHAGDTRGGDSAADLAAYVMSLASTSELQPAATTEALLRSGERLFGELACGACHPPDVLAKLSSRTDHAHVAGFLVDPSAHRPGLTHDFGLSRGEAGALAAWLLRMQIREEGVTPIPGFAFECFEFKIENGDQPELEGREATAQGVVTVIDVEQRTRQDHFAMRFLASLEVPAAGEWKFTTGSDDGSWLWIDGKLVVDNSGMKPHTVRSGAVQLEAGAHELMVVFTQGGGGKSLEVLWQGPGVDEQPVPADRANARTTTLTPPTPAPAPDAAAVARGRALASSKRCAACHDIDDPELGRLPPPLTAKPWGELGDGSCPESPAAEALLLPTKASLAVPLDDRARLALALRRDRCLSCHVRDGVGGLPAAVKKHLVETEDLGEEGRLPPDLSRVGYRLRQPWIEKVLVEGHRARPYLRVRMPRVAADRAAEYARLFAQVDAVEVVQFLGERLEIHPNIPEAEYEPVFSPEAVELGHKLAGVKGHNCISCHSFAGAPSLGPQGMDLAIQHERVRPAWFREWLLRAPVHRPGTRMPAFWPMATESDLREVDAIRTWLSLGAAAPIPEGLVPEKGSLVLLPAGRPVLHGAFLDGLSARCIAIGTQLRTHYAFDVEHGRLAWLWRGDFLDATGTWHGRAGKLVKPMGADWLVLEDFTVPSGSEMPSERTVLGHRIDADGYPVFRVRTAGAEYEDVTRPRLSAGGSELLRTLRCTKGNLKIEWQPQEGLRLQVKGEPAPASFALAAGEEVEVVYQW